MDVQLAPVSLGEDSNADSSPETAAAISSVRFIAI
jgi:hypothetical protein